MAYRDKFSVDANVDFARTYTVLGVDYTGATVQAQLRSAPQPNGTLFASADNAGVGHLTLTPSSTQSTIAIRVPLASLTFPAPLPRSAVFEIRVTTAGGQVQSLVKAVVDIDPGVVG